MKSVYDGYTRMDCSATYFAGANTAAGFTGLYSDIADEQRLERVYIIKGGAGTGKSTLIRKVADAAKNAGYNVEYYLCGSDPYSLDCVVLGGRIALLDGTAPHVRDMAYPGAASSLIDVSRFWDSGALELHRNQIIRDAAMKTACYESAYRYMRAAEAVDAERTTLAESLFYREKAAAYVSRFIKRLGKPGAGESGRVTVRYTRAVTMRGAYFSPVFEESAETVFVVADMLGCAVPFMNRFAEGLKAAGLDTVISRLPMSGHVDGIYLPGKRIAVVTAASEKVHKVINMSRFVVSDIPDGVRGRIKLAAKIEESCMEEALENLRRASDYHFALEEIYKQTMNFKALDKYVKEICTDVVSRLKK